MSHDGSSPNNGLRLLSFDGGGLHCVSQALIIQDALRRIEHDLSLPTPPRVSDYFDMICGSGFGGLLAIMCGMLHMTGDQLVEELVSLCKIVFSESLDVSRRTALYEETLKSMVGRFTEEGHNGRMLGDNNVVCKTFVCAASSHNVAHPRLFRNYQTRANASPDCPIWQAGRATTALPEVFNPIVIGQELIGETFSSGEVRWINPADELTREASDVFDATRHIACIVSIGSGHPQHLSLLHDRADIFRRMASDCEKLADDLERRFYHTSDVYRRVNVQQGFQGLDKFDIVTLEQVVSHTRAFLRSARTIFNLDSLIQDLVQRPLRVPVRSACGVLPPNPQVMRLKHVPPPTQYFVGRESLLTRLDNYFFLEPDPCHIAVLYGLGGSGKTQGSLKFIQQSQETGRFSEVFFVNASSQLTLENDLKAIVASKSLGTSMDDAMYFLRNHKAKWLLFLDNADDPKLDLHPFVAWGHGNVLITTRNSQVRAHAPRCSLHVDSLEENEAVSLLLLDVEAKEGKDTQETAKQIVQELGYLALAVNQARAFLAKGICNLEDYLRLYRDNHRALLADKPVQSTDNYEYSVYTTWTISFNQLSKEAALFLRLLCFMHHRSIPFTLFRDAQSRLIKNADYYKDALPALAEDFLHIFCGQSSWDLFRFHTVVNEVLSFSLLQSDPTNRVFHLHPLVQRWMQDQSVGDLGVAQATKAIISLATPWGESAGEYTLRRALLPHLYVAHNSIQHLHWKLLYSFWKIYQDAGFFAESCGIAEIELEGYKDCLGLEHPNTLESMGNLALTYYKLGRYREAVDLKEQKLNLSLRISGPEHPRTLTSMDNLAQTYSKLGRHSEALELGEQVVKLSKQILGPEHPNTLRSMSNLAMTYSDLGRHSEALDLKEQDLRLSRRMSGLAHPDTLTSMKNLALTYSDLGRHSEALDLNEQELKLGKQISGPEHPNTLTSMHRLAQTYSNLGRHSEALGLKEQVVTLRKRILGPEHPDTLTSMRSLAQIYSDLCRHFEALDLKEHVFELRKRILGPEHPRTLTSMSCLAETYSDLGRHSEALDLKAQVVELSKRILGPEHPRTLTNMCLLAETYSKLGRHSKALEIEEQELQLSKRISGAEHPETLTSMNNLAVTYSDLGRHSEALDLKEQVVKLRKQISGPEHPDTLTSMHNLAVTYSYLGRCAEALDLMQQVLELKKRVLGLEHPHTLISQRWVNYLRRPSVDEPAPKRQRRN